MEQVENNSMERLKEALYEICRYEFTREDAIDNLMRNHAKLVAETYGDNYHEIMGELYDLYDNGEYRDDEFHLIQLFSEWSQFYKEGYEEDLCGELFNEMSKGVSLYSAIENVREYSEAYEKLYGNSGVEEWELEDEEYDDVVTGECLSLKEWEAFFSRDEYGIYEKLKEIKSERDMLRDQVNKIKDILLVKSDD